MHPTGNGLVKNYMIENGKQIVLEIVNKLDPSSSGGQAATLTVQRVARVPLSYSNFQLARDETWWCGVRKGRLLPDLDAHEMRVIPGEDAGVGILDGYVIELTDGDRSYRRHFTNRSMANVANRKILEISSNKESEISLDDQYSYYITTVPADDDDQLDKPTKNFKSCREPLTFEHARLADYMANSKTLQGVSEHPAELKEPPMPIFVTEDVWQESKEHAHRGGEQESAALFSGRTFRDTESDELFLRIDACLEAAHAVEEKLAVTFTGETWAHARELLEIRRRRLNRPHEIIVGSVHRHPFLPSADVNGNRKCQACDVAKYCSRSTAVPSTDDFEWHRSVFSGQPYCVLLIWGYNAREQEDFRLYGLENASFKERTIRLLTEEL
jgi:hypothetical protein